MPSPDYQSRFSGLGRLYGTFALEKFEAAHIAVIGLGGVGSWTAEALARTGIGKITLIDLDDICITNVNRQLPALDGEIGRTKAASIADRLQKINPEGEIDAREEFFLPSNANELLGLGFDCVVDGIDNVTHKCELIVRCRERNIPIVVSGGAGGKTNPAAVSTADLNFATNDRLLKRLRKMLRRDYGFPHEHDRNPFGIPSVFSTQNAIYPWENGTVCETPEPGSDLAMNCESGFGSASFVTGTFGFAAAAEAINQLLLKKS